MCFRPLLDRVAGPALLTAAALGAAPPSAAGAPVKGPYVSIEQRAPARIVPEDVTPQPEVEVRRRRYETSLLAPIPVRALGGMFVLRADFMREERELSGRDAGRLPGDLAAPDAAALGFIFLPHAAEGKPRFFVAAARFGEMSLRDDAAPMTEWIVGADFDDDDLPLFLSGLKPSATDDASLRMALRFRNFPGFQRWVPAIGHRLVTRTGFGLDLQIPSQILASWQVPDAQESWKFYGGIRWSSREYPFDSGAAGGGISGWIEGYTTARLLGVRRHVAGPFYVALEGGMQNELTSTYDEKGHKLARDETKYSAFGRVAIETWIKTP